MCTNSLNNKTLSIAVASVLMCLAASAHAQLMSLPGFYEDHFRVEASNDKEGSKLRTQFDYKPDDTFFTSNSLKISNDGFENHTALGIAQSFGAVQARATYKLNQLNYASGQSFSDDMYFDLQYHSLRVQHRQEKATHVSSIGIPYELSGAHFDLAASYTTQENSPDTTNAYSIVSQLNGVKVAAAWQRSSGVSWTDVSSIYRLSYCWLVKLNYSDHGSTAQQQVRSEYTGRYFRFASEYTSISDIGLPSHNIGAFDIEKTIKIASLKMRVGYDDLSERTSLSFKIESHLVF